VLRELVDLSWRAHLQPTDAGWIDLAFDSPLLRTDRARTELDWSPVHSTADTLMSFVDALHHRRGGTRPLLQPRRLWPRIRSID
jgi:hypothetical protein